MRVVIVGCGRVGALVATRLSAAHDVTVIDWRPGSFDRLPADFAGELLTGNGIDVEVLRTALVGSADLFLALTDGDNRNLMSAQIASRLGAGRVIARVYDAVRSEIYAEMGLTTMSPTIKGAERLFAMVIGSQKGA